MLFRSSLSPQKLVNTKMNTLTLSCLLIVLVALVAGQKNPLPRSTYLGSLKYYSDADCKKYVGGTTIFDSLVQIPANGTTCYEELACLASPWAESCARIRNETMLTQYKANYLAGEGVPRYYQLEKDQYSQWNSPGVVSVRPYDTCYKSSVYTHCWGKTTLLKP